MGKRSRKKVHERTVYLDAKQYEQFAHSGKAESAFLAPGPGLYPVTVVTHRVKEYQGRIWVNRA
jgi:hypothetical protein